MPIAEQSKFACLKVEDDTSSSDEGERLMGFGKDNKLKVRKGNGLKSSKKSSGNGPLIVHVVPPKVKSKGKKGKKVHQVVDETGLIIQDPDADAAEMKYREELRRALKESYETSSLRTMQDGKPEVRLTQKSDSSIPSKSEKLEDHDGGKTPKKTPAEYLLLELDKEARKAVGEAGIGGSSKSVGEVMRIYRTKLLDILEENSRLTENLLKAQNNVDKYRSRYTKLCEILKDVELSEKAQLVVQLEKARKVETELGNQIGALRGELMQATSKNREYEAKIKELSKR